MTRALLHGFLGAPSVWTGIAAGNAIALPGHGGGDVQPTWRENIEAVAAQLGGATSVVGYSLGARVALGLLEVGAVETAVIISGNPGLADASFERPLRRTADAAWAQRFRTEPLADVLDAWEAQPLFATQTRAEGERIAARRRQRLALDPEQMARSLEVMGLAEMPDYRGVLALALAGGAATLVVGAEDTKYRTLAEPYAAVAAIHVIESCGHDPLLEQPAALAEVLASIA